MLETLQSKSIYLLDMDGTLYIGRTLIDGAYEFIQSLKQRGKLIRYITNNSSKSVADYQKKLKSLGIESTSDEYFTSSMASALYLNHHHKNKRVYCMGTESLKYELSQAGIPLADSVDEAIDVVLLGYDTELTYQKLVDVCWLLKRDIVYLATNLDYVCPIDFGFVPDCGSFADMIKNATGRYPEVIGKPHPRMINYAIEAAGAKKEDAVIIGDRLYTDILSGIKADVMSICVLSGETTQEDLAQSPYQPNLVVDSVKDLIDYL